MMMHVVDETSLMAWINEVEMLFLKSFLHLA